MIEGRLHGKVAVISGATRGLGCAIARLFHQEGATLYLTGRDILTGSRLAAELPGSRFHELDVRDEGQWKQLAGRVMAEKGAIHVLVNNAAIAHYGAIVGTDADTFREVLEVNLVGAYLGLREFAALLSAAQGASVINISSCAALEAVNGASAYIASKWGLTGLTKAAALEFGHAGVRVNSIHPHAIRTEMIASRETNTDMFVDQAIPRIAEVEEVASMALFLASADSGYCTGGEYLVDGGHMAGRLLSSMPGYPHRVG